ncbi:AfsR/SARP family transcriptional regulator [Streptomyces sp. NPDC050504]|uniref:AfsR/SARP family transcriptional regulator n=1 Tax=Streptomyces sp. NPDC050504 TaxID=3365618 RepID=UPI0037AD88BF
MEFGVLGPLEVRTDAGGRIHLGGHRPERLFAALLLHADSSVPVVRLVDAVWDGCPPATADRQVRNLVGVLRRIFSEAAPGGPPVLLTDGRGYRIPLDGHRLDARLFADRVARARADTAAGGTASAAAGLREALALWRGPALEGLSGGLIGAGGLALDESRLTAWEDCLDLEAALGRHRAMVPELTALVAEHPLRERFVGRLMRALHHSGRTADALAAHRLFVGRLAEETGLDPGPELRLLHRTLLTSEPGGTSGRDGVTGHDGTSQPGAASQPDGTSQPGAASQPGITSQPGPAAGRDAPAADGRTAPPGSTGNGRAPAGAGPMTWKPAQLPSAPATFTGRGAELAALDDFADRACAGHGARREPGTAPAPPAARICTVSGGAGVGKSTLVVQWAHRVRDRFPDGQLHADLRGFSDGPPLAPHTVLARFLRALGVPGEQVPNTPDEAAGLYRSLLAERRVLVLLDNAHSAEQVRPLLPGTPNCLTVVTSRTGLLGLTARDGAAPLTLGLMPTADAVALLDRVIGGDRARAEPRATAELASLCGRLPLALAIAASRLAERPGLSIADNVAELREAEDRLGALEIAGDATSAVRDAFDLTYLALPERARSLFRLLALAPAPDLGAPAAAALLGGRTGAVRPVLDQLVTAHLVTHEDHDRYRTHDLLRLYAAERVAAETSPAERAAARERLYTWYSHHAHAASLLITPHRSQWEPADPGPWYEPPGFTTVAGARAWCEREHTHLLGAVRDAAERGLDRFAWQIPRALEGYYFVSPHLEDRKEAARLAIAAAGRAGDRRAEGHARNDLATALCVLGGYDEALSELHRARRLFRSADDRIGEALTVGNLGSVALHTGAYEQAGEHFRSALAVWCEQPEESRDHWAIGAWEASIGISAMYAGDDADANEHLHRALDRHRAAGDPVLESRTLFYLGDHHRRQGRREQASARLREALEVINSAAENPLLRARVLIALEEVRTVPSPVPETGPDPEPTADAAPPSG